jgi:hypothetical protein
MKCSSQKKYTNLMSNEFSSLSCNFNIL